MNKTQTKPEPVRHTPLCARCGRPLTAEFQLGNTCHNTEACKRRVAKRLEYLRKELRAEQVGGR